MDLMDMSNEIQESLGRSYNVPDDIDEEEENDRASTRSCYRIQCHYYNCYY